VALKTRLGKGVGLTALIVVLASPALAQLGEQLKAYTGRNATGYFEPLIDAFGADLSAGWYHTARVPKRGLHVDLEIAFMSARFSDADRTFNAATESGFRPEQTAEAPTVVGPREAVRVDGLSGTSFYFPGGFDLSSFDFAVPQLRLGALYGTEAIIRFGLMYTGDTSLGDMRLYGFGARHSVSQYIDGFPVDVAVGFSWQLFELGKNERGGDLVSAQAWTVGFQASKRFSWWEPYAGVAYNDFGLDLSYEGETAEDRIDLSLDSNDHYQMTFGCSLHVVFAAVHGEYNIGGQNAFALGLAMGFDRQR
jgi:hypothetical protein